MKKLVLLKLAVIFLICGCQTNAESDYELNQRSGLSVGVDKETNNQDLSDRIGSASIKIKNEESAGKYAPSLNAPKVHRVWVNSQQIDDTTWLEGTWIYLQIEKAQWVLKEKAKGE